ncbi:L,D-transpeptidase [Lentzea sp. NPDC051208]|uniref:L,D-transpeptidase n=1 Tax=Lentzea sp. NPDC051208 TaxID=3154642 RepID=UPI003446F843
MPAQASACTVHNGACVQKHTNQAWATSGAAQGEERLERPYNGPMPNAVYFTADGVAFHQGDLNSQSHGCVRLTWADSEVFYDNLFPGERVQVLP